MSKAILILDEMPLYCDECPIQSDYGRCGVTRQWASGRREYNNCSLNELPCKVGDTIYFVFYDSVPGAAYINEITVTEVSNCRIWGDDEVFDYDDIGRTIFLRRDEAESRREEMERTAKSSICKITNLPCSYCQPVCGSRKQGDVDPLGYTE